MKKLNLDLDQIQVNSFSPQPSNGDRGTVFGQDATTPLHCTENCIPSPDTPNYSLICGNGGFTWPTCNDYQTCAGFVCPDMQVLPTKSPCEP